MKHWKNDKIAFFFSLPTGILILFFLVLPVLFNVIVSVFDIGKNPTEWFLSGISLDNYASAVLQDGLVNAVRNSVIYTIVTTIGATAAGLFAALCLTEPFKGRTVVIFLIMVSWSLPSYVVGIFFGYVFQQDNSLINHILFDILNFHKYSAFLGFEWSYNELGQLITPRWLDNKYSILTVAIPAIWHYFPYSMLLFLAGLSSIKSDIYSAATMDGANKIERLFYITFPILQPVFIVVFIQNLLINIYSFNIVVMMFGNGTIIPSKEADMIIPYIFRTSFQYWNLGIGASLSTMLIMIVVGVSVLYHYKRISAGKR